MSDSLGSHGLQPTRLPCPSPSQTFEQEFAQTHVHCVSDAIHLILCHPHRVMIQRTREDQLPAEQGTVLLEKQQNELSSKHGVGF